MGAGYSTHDAAVPDGLPQAEALTDPGRHGQLDDVDVTTSDDGTVEVATDRDAGPGMGCQEDYNPYRMLLAVDRVRLPNATNCPPRSTASPAAKHEPGHKPDRRS